MPLNPLEEILSLKGALSPVEEVLTIPQWVYEELRRLEEILFERIAVEHYEIMQALEEDYPEFEEFIDAFSSLHHALLALN